MKVYFHVLRYFFIINPISGNTPGPAAYERAIKKILGATGAEFDIRLAKEKGHAGELAREAASQGWDTVTAVGGDGTINEIGSSLLGKNTALGIVPKGSGNGLAGELGLPRNPEQACKTLLKSIPLRIDAGRANHRYFLNLAGVGLDACVGHAFNAQSRRRGLLPYFLLTLREALRYRAPRVEIKTPGEALSCEILTLAVANAKQYGAGAVIAPKAKMNDGLFHVTVARRMPLYQALWAAPRLFTRTVDRIPGVRILAVPRLTLRFSQPVPYHLDGEPFRDFSELEFEILPKALTLLVPPGYRP